MMRNTILILLLLFNPLTEQKKARFSGALDNFYSSYIFFDIPHKGGAVEANQIKVSVEDDARFRQTIDMAEPGFIGMPDSRSGIYLRFWLEPGEELGFQTDWNDLVNTISFSGELAKANQLVRDFDLERQSLLQSEDKLSAEDLFRLISAEKKELQQAYEEESVSDSFYELMLLDSKYFWISRGLVSASLSPEAVRAELDISSEQGLKSRNYFVFLRSYFKAMKTATLEEKYARASDQLSDEVLELFWVYDIRQESMSDRLNFDLLHVLEAYKEQFNDQILLTYLRKYLIKIENEHYRMNTPITEEMELVVDSDFTIQDIIEKFRGTVLYFDMWATWCHPCIDEMNTEFKKPFDEFLEDKPVKVIYLSLDIDRVDAKWRQMVRDMRLNSFNIRMTDERYDEVREYIGVDPRAPFAIPRYFIVNKKGRLVNADAPRPSDGQLLYRELSKYF
ncbi:TlpA family protein disulfide reductase [Roseivirga sp.]|uniref:TlpA family protein disulfide reductase n=1 Tax=Roseivirga sp. TaxID=1964215 RepID=UPI003B51A887